MLSSATGSCFVAALFCTLSLADPIAFGNPAFSGITFGRAFTISWFGGDGTPVNVDLMTGNPASMQPVTTLANNYSGTAVSWTPVATESVRSGQLYALSIAQSGLTNYSPLFGINAGPALLHQVYEPYGVPIPLGTGQYYPIASRAVQDDAKVHNSDLRLVGTGAIFPRQYATGTPIGYGVPRAYMTGTEGPRAYATGTSTGSFSGARAAAATTYSSTYINDARRLSLGWIIVAKLLSTGFVLSLLRM